MVSMELGQILHSVLTIAVAVFGFFFKKLFDQLEEGARRMTKMEKEISRQKQQADDLDGRLDRIEAKLDRLLERD